MTVSFVEVEASKRSLSMRGKVLGNGVNDSWYITDHTVEGERLTCPYYRRWKNMLKRAYHRPYSGITVCKEWLTFSVFREWMEGKGWEGKELDKDIIKPGNKEYGPKTCCFVSQHLNKLFGAARGPWPKGVSYSKREGKFKARCLVDGRGRELGGYDTPEGAEEAYKKFKAGQLLLAANGQDCPVVAEGLKAHARLLEGER